MKGREIEISVSTKKNGVREEKIEIERQARERRKIRDLSDGVSSKGKAVKEEEEEGE